MKTVKKTSPVIALGRVTRETRAIGGRVPEMSNPILSYNPT